MYTPDILQAPDHELVCYCARVSKGRILKAVQEGGRTLEQIKALTGACSVGRCRELNPRGR